MALFSAPPSVKVHPIARSINRNAIWERSKKLLIETRPSERRGAGKKERGLRIYKGQEEKPKRDESEVRTKHTPDLKSYLSRGQIRSPPPPMFTADIVRSIYSSLHRVETRQNVLMFSRSLWAIDDLWSSFLSLESRIESQLDSRKKFYARSTICAVAVL